MIQLTKSRFILHIALMLFMSNSFAQEISKRYYGNDDNELRDSVGCYYYELLTLRTDQTAVDTIKSYYCDTNSLRSIEPIEKGSLRHGIMKRFDKQGNLILTGTFRQGSPEIIEQYYPNGKQQSIEVYDLATSFDRSDSSRIMFYWDSLGNVQVDNGKGQCTCYLSEYYEGADYQVGQVLKGRPNGTWKGFYKDGMLYFEEIYQDGAFQSGISYDSLSNRYVYQKIKETAMPPGGIITFYQFVSRSLKYPASARRNGTEGKVFIEFIVEKDGTISQHKVIHGIGGGCDEEALEVVKKAPRWNPGRMRGQLIRQRFIVPITFKLG
jgi:TonB family protein